jgi:SAM-dependent methyltransferase
MSSAPDLLTAWLEAPLGRALLAREQQAVSAALEHAFGTQCLQIGTWGPPDQFLPHARTTRRALIAEPGAQGDVVSHATQLAVLSGSVDVVILPHTLEFEPEPHGVLREVDRILVGEGHVLVLGFEPWGPWALRHRLSRQGFPPGLDRILSQSRLRDWLTLLGFEVESVGRYLHAVPFARLEGRKLGRGLERASRWLAARAPLVNPAGAYLLTAKKRVYTLTPVRRARRHAARVAGALVEPTRRLPS